MWWRAHYKETLLTVENKKHTMVHYVSSAPDYHRLSSSFYNSLQHTPLLVVWQHEERVLDCIGLRSGVVYFILRATIKHSM